MTSHRQLASLFVAVLVVVVTACSAATILEAPPAPTEPSAATHTPTAAGTAAPAPADVATPTLEPVDVVAVDEIVVIYEQGGCRYNGPSGIAAARVTVILDKPKEVNVQVSVLRFDAGETWQQLVETFAAKNRGVEYPVWAEDSFLSARPVLDNFQARIYELTPGSYGITCEEFPPEGTIVIHLAAPFNVR